MRSELAALRVVRRDRRGSSSPVVVETADGLYFVKLRGAAQATASLVAEVIVGALADRLGLPVPSRRMVMLASDTPSLDRNDELADLLRASVGENLGFLYLENARAILPSDVERMSPDFASQVRWLDWLVLNPDRGPKNPNILTAGGSYWLIDHGAALPFQHDWSRVTEASPRKPARQVTHVLDAIATRMTEWDASLTEVVTRSLLADIVSEIPMSFLAPLVPPGARAEQIERRRAAYAAFLWKRLQGPRDFSTQSA